MIDRRVLISGSMLAALLAVRAAAGAQPAAPPPAGAAALPEAAAVQSDTEDLLLLEALRSLRLSSAQQEKLLPLARGVHDRLQQLAGDETRRLLTLKATVADSRQRLLAGEAISTSTEEQLRFALEAAGRQRTASEDDLVRTTSARLAAILTRPQMEVIYGLSRGRNPGGGWTSPLLQGHLLAGLQGSYSPAQEYARRQEWFQRDLDRWYQHGKEGKDLIRELTYGIPQDTPQYQQAASQAGTLLDQIKAMPADVYAQQLNAMLDRMVRANLQARQQEEQARFLAAQTPAQQGTWLAPFVRRVFFSPRIVPVLAALLDPRLR